jgi:hypothetical protein
LAKDSGYRSGTQTMVGFVLRWIIDRLTTFVATVDGSCRLAVVVLFASFRALAGV